MFSIHTHKAADALTTRYFLDWLAQRVLINANLSQAERIFSHLARVAPRLIALRQTPQTLPYHSEGPMVYDHVIRMLAGVEAVVQGASLLDIEEFFREKELLLEFQALDNVIRSHAGFLMAYAVCHDAAKAETLAFDTRSGGLGEKEGFGQKGQPLHLASQPVIDRYNQLRQAYLDQHSEQEFFETYGIAAHYPDHGRVAATAEYSETRVAVLEKLALPMSQAKLLTELIRVHMEVIYAFADKPDAAKYTALAKSADKLGLNVQLFLDLLPAVVFVDAVLGSLTCQVDSTSQARPHHCSADLKVLINLLTAELEAMPDRHASRRLAADRGYKQAIKEVMTEAGLSPEIVFALLVIPIGPARGRVMEKIYALVRDPESTVDFGQHQQELRERAFRARQLLADRHLSI